MDADQRYHSLGSSSRISSRKLPDLPPEAYSSRISRLWSSFKHRLSLGSSNNSNCLRRSQIVNSSAASSGCYRTSLPYSIYYHLIDNHESMVLPGLRQYPPPIEDDDELPSNHELPMLPSDGDRSPDYANIYEGQCEVAADSSEPIQQAAQVNEYDDIDDLSTPKSAALRSAPGRRQHKKPKIGALASSIGKLHHRGWYWGPLNRVETENKLRPLTSGSFLVRDSSDAHHLYTLSFKQDDLILHTRIEFVNGLFTFFLSNAKARETGKPSVEELIETSMAHGVKGEFGESHRARGRQQRPPIRIQLTYPVSRFNEVRSLQFLCKFVLRANMNRDNVPNLPLPVHVRSWVHEKDYF